MNRLGRLRSRETELCREHFLEFSPLPSRNQRLTPLADYLPSLGCSWSFACFLGVNCLK
jgi:hypothetical protein